MRARAKPQTSEAADPSTSHVLLPAASAAEISVQQLLTWAQLIPPFAGRLIGTASCCPTKISQACYIKQMHELGRSRHRYWQCISLLVRAQQVRVIGRKRIQ